MSAQNQQGNKVMIIGSLNKILDMYIREISEKVPFTFTRICREAMGNSVSLERDDSNVANIVPSDVFYWNMICKDAIGNLVFDDDTIAQASKAIEALSAKLGEDVTEAFIEWAQERAIVEIEIPDLDETIEEFKKEFPLYQVRNRFDYLKF
jgi:hypothetical protein